MKKKILIIVTIILLVIGGAYLIDKNRMKNNEEVLFSTWGAKYTPSLETNNKENDGKIVITHDKIENLELLDRFLDNTNSYNENKVSDSITIVTYTTEGDEIIKTLKYSKDEARYELTVDNLADKFAAKEDRKVETQIYSDLRYNVTKKIIDDNIYLMIEEDPEITICYIDYPEEVTILCLENKDTNI